MPPAHKPSVAKEKSFLCTLSNIAIGIADHHAILMMDGQMWAADFNFDWHDGHGGRAQRRLLL